MNRETGFYLWVSLLSFAIWVLAFELVGFTASHLPGHQISTRWDQLIPLMPGAVWVYLLGYLVPLAAPWILKNRADFQRAFLAIFTATACAFVCYFSFPVFLPQPVPPATLSGKVLALQLALDFNPSANKLPSLHVAIPWIFFFATRHKSTATWLRAGLLFFALASSAAAVLVKQHLLWDIAAGFAVALLAWLFAGKAYSFLAGQGPATAASFKKMAWKLTIICTYSALFWLVLPAALWGMAFTLNKFFPIHSQHAAGWALLGWAMVLPGAFMCFSAMKRLWQIGGGLPISHLPPQNQVRKGIYRMVRHPIYVGCTALFGGVSLVMGWYWGFWFAVPVLTAGWLCYAVFFEEPRLVARFGANYLVYRGETPLLLPPKWTARLQQVALPMSRFWSKVAARTVLYQTGPVIFVSFGMWVALGMMTATPLSLGLLYANGLEKRLLWLLPLGSLVLGLSLARGFWWLGNWHRLQGPLWQKFRRVGYVSYGGFIGATVFAFVFAHYHQVSLLLVSDAFLTGLFLAYAFGRVGCLTYGCCYGVLCARPALIYEDRFAKVVRERGFDSQPRFATQIYSAGLGFCIFLAVFWLQHTGPPVGLITGLSLVLYGFGRAIIEFMRDRRKYLGAVFTSGHLGCLFVLCLGWAVLIALPGDSGMRLNGLGSAGYETLLGFIWPTLPVGLITFWVLGFHWRRIGWW